MLFDVNQRALMTIVCTLRLRQTSCMYNVTIFSVPSTGFTHQRELVHVRKHYLQNTVNREFHLFYFYVENTANSLYNFLCNSNVPPMAGFNEISVNYLQIFKHCLGQFMFVSNVAEEMVIVNGVQLSYFQVSDGF